MNHWQKKELFHVKYYPPNALIFFTRARLDFQIPTPGNANNAECAPEMLAQGRRIGMALSYSLRASGQC